MLQKVLIAVLVAATYPLSWLALRVAARGLPREQRTARIIALYAFLLFIPLALIVFCFLRYTWIDSVAYVKEITLLIISALSLLLILLAAWLIGAALVRRMAAQPFPGLLGSAFGGALALVSLLTVLYTAAIELNREAERREYNKGIAQYYSVGVASAHSALDRYGVALPPRITKFNGEGTNRYFKKVEEKPNMTATEPGRWHGRFPPEYVYMFYSEQAPSDLLLYCGQALHEVGFSLYWLGGQGMPSGLPPNGLYLAGYKPGVFVEYSVMAACDREHLKGGQSDTVLRVWLKYAGQMGDLAKQMLKPAPDSDTGH